MTSDDFQTTPPPDEARAYEAPAILWEQPFVALAQISQCQIPGESECIP
ncbi:hypothetical protein [Corallococcus macrosporus]|uniref:Uncharacterized protein n=2 Tax=Myxococcaceae TaxID=31 RepID=A0A250JW29_9BACT|nr:hypothetical protein [Corallococcus macrosporus]AEI67257.1 hypothetical protein LILAB_26825 [Corallococcus macrosporus]ATB48055.1 hypothetical protein MYMAC_003678 [Corallococcus macrosporus DSM 14697]